MRNGSELLKPSLCSIVIDNNVSIFQGERSYQFTQRFGPLKCKCIRAKRVIAGSSLEMKFDDATQGKHKTGERYPISLFRL